MHHSRWMLCLMLVTAAFVWGQRPGALTGKITDSKGAGMPGAVIVITETATGSSQRVVTEADGTFTVAELPAGSYRMEVEAQGTKRTGRQNVEIVTGSPSNVEIVFDEGSVGMSGGQTGTVEIRAMSPTVQTDSAEVSRQYGTRVVRSLPIMDRQAQELIGLMPGITPPTYTQDRILDPQRVRTFNVNGQPDFANVTVQDGAYATEAYTNNASRVQPVESIQSLNIRTSNYNAEYGFSGGSWTNTVTRPGTNGFHGSLFAFNSNSFFATRNPVNAPGNPSPRFNNNQFGGTAGGAIIPNRLFLFGSYDGALRRGNETMFATVPTQALRAGNFTGLGGTIYNPLTGNATTGVGRMPFNNGMIGASQINPTSAAILNALPLPNQPGLTNNLVGNVRQIEDNHRIDGKIDHRFSDRTYGFFRYGFTHADVERGSLLGPLGDAARSGMRNHSAVAAVSTNVSNTLLGEFRLGYHRYRNAITPVFGLDSQFGQQLAAGGFTGGLPQININGFSAIGQNFAPKSTNDTWNPATNWILHTGMHRLKFGAEAHVIRATGFDAGQFSPLGTFTFGAGPTFSPVGTPSQFNTSLNSFASFLLGAPTQAGVANFTTTPTWQQTRYAGYITDTVNLWQRLYLELGVRYDFYTAYEPRFGSYGVFNNVQNTFGFNNNVDYDYNNFAPRVGLAFRPVDRLVFRAGYGMHYFPTPISLSPINLPALGAQAGLTGGYGSVAFRNPAVPSNGAGSDAAGNFPYNVGTDINVKTPLVHTYSAMIQGDLGNGFLMDVGYVGTMGRFLPYRSVYAAQPGSGLAGLPLFSQGRTAATYGYNNGANNNYNSLQVNLTKRMASGLAFAGAYTWSRAMDTGSDLVNPFDRNANYARADYDRRHILAVSHVWNLPFGAGSPYANTGAAAHILGNWELNGVLRWATGTPYYVTADPLFCACPGLAGVPANFTGTGNLNGASSFDPSNFATAGAGQFGSLGRNSFSGPDMFTYNLSLFRNFPIRENVKLEFRGEAYNLTNSTNLVNPVSNLFSPGFGQSFRTFNGMGGRTFQVAGRLLF